MAEQTPDRLSRLLALVPFLLDHDGVGVDETARHFGVDRDQVIADLNLLLVSGTPGHYPDDLIEVSWEDDQIYISNVRGISAPLRLSQREATSLIAALQALRTVPGLGSVEVVDSALRKISSAAGQNEGPAALDVALDDPSADLVVALRQAMADKRQVRLRYVSATDRVTLRDVDPHQLLTADGHWYLRAFCHLVGAERHFRLDRISDIETSTASQVTSVEAVEPDLTFEAERAVVSLEIAPEASWLIDSLPVTTTQPLSDGWIYLELWVLDPEWFRRTALGLGDRIREIHPGCMRDELAVVAKAALDQYSSSGSGK